jgi:hypothetical protein
MCKIRRCGFALYNNIEKVSMRRAIHVMLAFVAASCLICLTQGCGEGFVHGPEHGTAAAVQIESLAHDGKIDSISRSLAILAQSSSAWDSSDYTAYPPGQPQITVFRLTLPPHSALDWHTHAMPTAA